MPKLRDLRRVLPAVEHVAPRCRHFGECGGCSLQDVAYADQVAMKRAWLEALFGADVDMVPSPESYGYRTRMDYVFAFGRAGLRKRGERYHVIDLTECHLVPPRVFEAFRDLREVVRAHEIPDYDYRINWGLLRYLVFRHAPTTDQLLINIVATEDNERLVPLFDAAQSYADGVAIVVNDQPADVSSGTTVRRAGAARITERIGGMTFAYGPESFAQNNMPLVERLYAHVVDRCTGPTLDLCCGVGTIACLAARRVPQVWGVEVVEEAVQLARENAAANGVHNAAFACGRVRAFLKEFLDAGLPAQTVVLDPPRSGTSKKVMERVQKLRPERVLYVACNPSALKQELEWLPAYRPVRFTAYDLFPQTPHIEVLCELAIM